MKKLLNLMMVSAVFALASCSNDESVTPGNEQTTDAQYYLTVNIHSAENAMGRNPENESYDPSTDPEKGFSYSKTEHNVSTADFFFFDDKGIYVAQANVWDNGKDVTTQTPSIEFEGNSVVVLRGLTKNQTPAYMVTVLNAPAGLVDEMRSGETSLAEFRKKVTTWQSGQNFVMTTSSYLPNGETHPVKKDFEDKFFGATPLNSNNLVEDPDKLGEAIPVQVYVERLAAKFTFEGALEYEIPLTLSGNDNKDIYDSTEEPDQSGDTHVKVKITGLAVTATAKNSYLVKDLVEPEFATKWANWEWNSKEHKRTYWGGSLNYDKADETGLDFTPYNLASSVKTGDNVSAGNAVVYANENTKSYNSIIKKGTDATVNPNVVTNIVFTADISFNVKTKTIDEDGQETYTYVEHKELINYDGNYYLPDNFKRRILEKTKRGTSKLNFFKKSQEVKDGQNVDVFTQVSTEDFNIAQKTESDKNDVITMKYSGADTDKFFTRNIDATGEFVKDDNGEYTYSTTAEATVTELEDAITTTIANSDPTRYNGHTYYTIPIEHLLGEDNNYTVAGDGEFGVVRNHWYQFKIEGISRLGHGVFDPDKDLLYPEDPTKKTYALKAKVNILSWKIVKQTINIK